MIPLEAPSFTRTIPPEAPLFSQTLEELRYKMELFVNDYYNLPYSNHFLTILKP